MIVDGYVRVSQVGGRSGERFISPDLQREHIERWAKLVGASIAHVFEELDESGGRKDRPLLLEAIARVERGESDGVVVAYASRFSRRQVDGLLAIDRITKAGGVFISAAEGIDYSSDVGRHMVREMLSWAEYGLDQTRANWAAARARAVARGVLPGVTPYGYCRRRDGRLAVDRVTGPIVAELFRRRAEGARMTELIRWLADGRIKSPMGMAEWHHTPLRFMLRRRVYLGEIRHGPDFNPHGHEALVDAETWERAQWPPEMRLPPRGVATPLLSGILRCAGCQRVMWSATWNPHTSSGGRKYFCGHRSGELACAERPSVQGAVIEPYIEQVFWQQLSKGGRVPGSGAEARVRERLAQRERELDAYRDNPRLVSVLGGEKFARGLEVRARRLDKARLELARARLHPRQELPRVGVLHERWPDMSAEERRDAIASVIGSVFVKRGRTLDRRVFVYLRGHGPRDLPPPCVRLTPPGPPFDPSIAPPAVGLEPVADLGAAELRQALAQFLEGRPRWPNFSEFQHAGLGRLYWHIERHGGPRHWAGLLDLPWLPPRAEREPWPDERVRAELTEYLKDKTAWPKWTQFRIDGRGHLRDALKWSGGPTRWAKELGVELPAGRHEATPWTYLRMKAEFVKFANGRQDWPTRSEFIAADQVNLYNAIQKAGIRQQLASELGMHLPAGRKAIRGRSWTEPVIQTTLDEFLKGRTIWPSTSEFAAAGLGGLRDNLYRAGTLDSWATRYGLPVRCSGGQRRST